MGGSPIPFIQSSPQRENGTTNGILGNIPAPIPFLRGWGSSEVSLAGPKKMTEKATTRVTKVRSLSKKKTRQSCSAGLQPLHTQPGLRPQ